MPAAGLLMAMGISYQHLTTLAFQHDGNQTFPW